MDQHVFIFNVASGEKRKRNILTVEIHIHPEWEEITSLPLLEMLLD